MAISGVSLFTRLTQGDPTDTPDAAFRRLQLPGRAGSSYSEIVRLSATELRIVGRRLDDERESLQQSYEAASTAIKALQKVEELLGEADKVVSANQGAGPVTRRMNQKKLDDLLEQMTEAIKGQSPQEKAALDGSTTLRAGKRSLKLDRVSLDTLGRTLYRGRSYTVGDLARRGELDATRHPRSVRAAEQTIAAATREVKQLRKEIETFQAESLRPRLGDVATTLEGIFDARYDTLTSTSDAMATAREIREMVLTSATLATSIGADGWDRERVIDLIT
jgi:flagellin-like hook-associated protein FlgL